MPCCSTGFRCWQDRNASLESLGNRLKKAQGQFLTNLISGMESGSNDPVQCWKTEEVGRRESRDRQELRLDMVSMATLGLHDYERDQLLPRKPGDSHHAVQQS